MPLDAGLLAIAAFFGVAILAVALSGSRAASAIVYGLSLVVSVTALVFAAAHLESAPVSTTLPLGLPWLGAHFRVDPLAAFFLIVVNLGAAAASLYALGYGRHETAPERVLPFFPAFPGAMNLVILADDAFTFLLSWEFMSLASWAMVMSHHREQDNARAGYTYLVMASFGTLCLLLAFGLLAGAGGSYAFEDMRAAVPPGGTAVLVLALVLIGAGSKAGLVPLHVWLPLAHPAAPSHVSALMSGVMTKVAVYGFVRIVFELLGPPDWWWSMIVLALGALTAVMGVLYALMQHDLKRLLAYHTVENIGIVFIGLGLALAFKAQHLDLAAALAATAALFHVFNHSVFKSLLFFGSGAVLASTGERDMERMGGLIRRMPQTALAFLVGCVAISALPPLNGFASEWLTFQAILLSPQLDAWGLKFLVPAAGAALALSAALAAACFVKAYGVSFLGRPRTPQAANARETDFAARAAMFAFAALCLIAGVVPGFFMDALSPAVQLVSGGSLPAQGGLDWFSIVPVAESRSSYNGLLVFLFIVLSAGGMALAVHMLVTRATRRAPAWDCGAPNASPLAQYSAGSFAQPIRRIFGSVAFAARESVEMPAPGETKPARLHLRLRDFAWEALYTPLVRATAAVADRLNRLQFLSIRKYLSLVFVALVTLLLVLAIWS